MCTLPENISDYKSETSSGGTISRVTINIFLNNPLMREIWAPGAF